MRVALADTSDCIQREGPPSVKLPEYKSEFHEKETIETPSLICIWIACMIYEAKKKPNLIWHLDLNWLFYLLWKLQFNDLTRHKTVQCFLICWCWCDHKTSKRSTGGVLCQLARIHYQTIIQVLKRLIEIPSLTFCKHWSAPPSSDVLRTLMKALILLDMMRMFGTVGIAAKFCERPASKQILSDDGFNG